MLTMKNIFILALLLSGPAALYAVYRGLILILDTDGMAAFLVCGWGITVALLGGASLFDKLTPQSHTQQDDL